jgi:hypothetical protein
VVTWHTWCRPANTAEPHGIKQKIEEPPQRVAARRRLQQVHALAW